MGEHCLCKAGVAGSIPVGSRSRSAEWTIAECRGDDSPTQHTALGISTEDFMAKARAIVKRRKAVRNIRKITKTMQMIATAVR